MPPTEDHCCPITGQDMWLLQPSPLPFDIDVYTKRERLRTAYHREHPARPLPQNIARTPNEARHFIQGLEPPLKASRQSALKPARTKRPIETLPDLKTTTAQAHLNASSSEWQKARATLLTLTQSSMTAAESGVQLYHLLRTVPGLLAEKSSGYTTPCSEGSRGSSRISPDLLPLPCPDIAILSNEHLQRWYRSTTLQPAAITHGAEAWLALVIVAINAMGGFFYNGPPSGPATEAQTKAINLLRADCQHFVKDDSARSPTDLIKELGAKAISYWGEPVYTAADITVAQVLPTLPAP